MIEPGYARGGEIASKLAKLMQMLKSAPAEAAPAIEKAAQHAVIKPNGEIYGAPFDFKVSADHIANNLNRQLPGHTVREIPTDLSPLDRYTPQAPAEGAKLSPEEVDRLMSQSGGGNYNGMAEGGQVEAFDPVSSARQRVSSSPGSPGISGAIKDAVNALRSYLMTSTQNEASEDKRQRIDSVADEHADGGTVEGPSTEHEAKAGLGKRFGVRLMEQAYGLDSSGKPALGGRAWTEGQGGTPAGILDEITAAPHNLLSLAKSIRGLDPVRRLDPTYRGMQEKADSWMDKADPQWSRDASDRLEQLRAGMNKQFGVGEAHSLPEHMTDAAASLVTPVPMTKAGESAGLIKRLLEMATPLRPRTLKNFATDTAVLGGVGTGLDALTERLSKLHAQTGSQGGGASVDPSHFSQDMGLQPEDHEIHNSHDMVPMVTEHGDIYYGVPPETL